MSTPLKEFDFEKAPLKMKYLDAEPLKLNSEFIFFHNKSKFRKELIRLQYLFKSYTKFALHAAGIRDSYLKQEYSDKFFVILFTIPEMVKKINDFIEAHSDMELNPSCFYLETTSDFILLLSRDMEGLSLGIGTMELILKQVLDDYINQKRYDDYIKIRPFEILNCGNSPV